MGMFDTFHFEDGILPNNKVPAGYEFQTKSLGCNLDKYIVDAEGNVKKKTMWNNDGEEEYREITGFDKPINEAAHVYSHEFIYDSDNVLTRKHLQTKYQEYKIVIVNSKVAFVEKISEEGY